MTALHPFQWEHAGDPAHRLSPLPTFDLEVARDLGLAARSHVPVLITGNHRDQRERMARLIHYNGARRTQSIVIARCQGGHVTWQTQESPTHDSARMQIRSGPLNAAFDDARNGTIFVDDLCDLQPEMQGELSTLLEINRARAAVSSLERPQPAARIITGASRLFCDALVTRTFDQSLFYRLNSIHIAITSP